MPTNNFQVTQGSGTTIATEQGSGLEHYQKIKLIDPTVSSTSGIGVAANPLKIDPTGTTPQPVSQSGSWNVSVLNDPDAGVPGAVVPANAAFIAGTDGTNLRGLKTDTSGNLLVIQPTASNLNATVTVANPALVAEASLCVSATAATGVAVTATLPAVASNFHCITLIEILKYFTVANSASATPLVVTTTNLPGSLAFTFGQPAGAIGVTDRMIHAPGSPVRSSVVNTATTIVCPATTGIIWRVNVYYFLSTF